MPLATGTLVQTEDGVLREIQCLQSRQRVWVRGKYWQPASLIPKGDSGTIEIRTSDSVIRCASSHPVPVRGDRGIVEKKAKDVTQGDLIASAQLLPEGSDDRTTKLINSDRIACQAKRAHQPLFVDDDLAYFVGYLTGDGSAHSHNSKHWNRVSWSDQDYQLAELVGDIAAKTFDVKTRIFKRKDADCYVGYVDGVMVGEFLRTNFESCVHRGATNRRAPECIQRLNNSGVGCFLAGLFDAEGHVSSSRITLGMVSPTLIEQVVLLLRRLGIYCSTGTYLPRPVGKHRVYRITIADFVSLVRFSRLVPLRSSRKSARLSSVVEKKAQDRVGQSDLRDVPHFYPLVAQILSDLSLPTTVLPNFRNAKARRNLCITGGLANLWVAILRHFGGGMEELQNLWSIKWTSVHTVETGHSVPVFDLISPPDYHFRGSSIFTQGLPDSLLASREYSLAPSTVRVSDYLGPVITHSEATQVHQKSATGQSQLLWS